MPVRAVCKPHSPQKEMLGVMVRTREGYIGAVTRMGVRFRGVRFTHSPYWHASITLTQCSTTEPQEHIASKDLEYSEPCEQYCYAFVIYSA